MAISSKGDSSKLVAVQGFTSYTLPNCEYAFLRVGDSPQSSLSSGSSNTLEHVDT